MAQPSWLVMVEAAAAIASIAFVAYTLLPKGVSQSDYSYYTHMCGNTRCY